MAHPYLCFEATQLAQTIPVRGNSRTDITKRDVPARHRGNWRALVTLLFLAGAQGAHVHGDECSVSRATWGALCGSAQLPPPARPCAHCRA